jgi:hypothetical protein
MDVITVLGVKHLMATQEPNDSNGHLLENQPKQESAARYIIGRGWVFMTIDVQWESICGRDERFQLNPISV